ncbi:MAG: 3-hydroxyacyl-CoA dehydrogenase NAD-binding domain-containing protein [Alphaproteobacteria bacterium]
MIDSAAIRRVACVGTGLMGSGWVAHFLRHGLDVMAYDLDPKAESMMRKRIELAWPIVERLGLAPGASMGRVTFTTDLKAALDGAEFVQESAVENEALKIDLLAKVDSLTAPGAVISSSSSGFLAARLRSKCKHGGRVIVGHPFNPPYLIPLVEIAGGDGVDQKAIDAAVAFYKRVNSRPVVLKREIDGYIANRLQMAVLREIYYMVGQGVASVGDIDDALTYGPGVRWAVKGPIQIFYLGAPTPDRFGTFIDLMEHEMETFLAPPGPTLTPAIKKQVIEEADALAAGKSHAQLLRERDEGVLAILKAIGVAKG